MKTGLSLLEEWYAARCDGDWEHSWGVKIDTLDNPGWTISINLNDTRAESRNLERLKSFGPRTTGFTTGSRKDPSRSDVGR
jgi:hypothetical protein